METINQKENLIFYLGDETRNNTITNGILFNNIDECVSRIVDGEDEKIFLIISNKFNGTFISLIHDIPQLAAIYILCNDCDHQSRTEEWATTNLYPKVRGIFVHTDSILKRINKDMTLYSDNQMLISIFADVEEKSTQNLDKQSANFLWFHILIEILLRMPHKDDAKIEMINLCKVQYADDKIEMEKVLDFENNYNPKNAIYWYTRDSFLYRLLNKALRTENIDIIFKFRYFICDVHNQLCNLYALYISTLPVHGTRITLYRGQNLSTKEFQNLQQHIGSFMSMNTFTSATVDRDVALIYAGDGSNEPLFVSVLIEISIDSGVNEQTFANIAEHSYFKDESEVLFSIGTVFQIESIEKLTENPKVWCIKLLCTETTDKELKKLVNFYKKDIQETTSVLILGKFMCAMGDYDRAKQYYEMLLEQLPLSQNKEDYNKILHNIAYIQYIKGEYADSQTNLINSGVALSRRLEVALKNNKSLTLDELRSKLPMKDEWAGLLANIARINADNNKYDEALQNYQSSLNYLTYGVNIDYEQVGIIYANIAVVYAKKNEPQLAFKNFDLALECFQKAGLPEEHPMFSFIYNNMATLHGDNNDIELAFKYTKKALHTQEKYLPKNHLSKAGVYQNLGCLYNRTGEYDQALDYYHRALDIRLLSLPQDHQEVLVNYEIICFTYHAKKDFVSTIKYCNHLIELLVKSSTQQAKLTLLKIYELIAQTYQEIGEYSKELNILYEIIAIILKSATPNNTQLGLIYNRIASCHIKMKNYKIAMEYYRKYLDLQLKSRHASDPTIIASLYFGIGNCHHNMNEYQAAINNYQKALSAQLQIQPLIHSKCLVIYVKLGECFENQHNYDDALQIYDKGLSLLSECQSMTPDEKVISVHFCQRLCLVHRCLNDYMSALKIIRKGLAMAAQHLLSENNMLGFFYKEVIDLYKHFNDLDTIMDLSLQCNAVIDDIQVIGKISRVLKRFEIAIRSFELALTIARKYTPTDHSLILSLSKDIEETCAIIDSR